MGVKILEEWVYAGERVSSDNKLCQMWIPLPFVGNQEQQNYRMFGKDLTKWPIIGGIYELKVEHNEDGKVSVSLEPQWTGRRITNDHAERFRADELENESEYRRVKEAKEAHKEDPLLKHLDPIREQYRKTFNPQYKRALLAAILEYLTR